MDLIAAVFLLGFFINGFRKGFILTLGHLVGIVAGVLSARWWSPVLAAKLGTLSTFGIPRGWFYVAASIILFFFVAEIVLVIASLLNTAFKILTIIPFLESLNKIAGAFLGFVVGVSFVGGVAYLVATSRIDPIVTSYFDGSHVIRWCQTILFTTLHPWL